jgi:parvulin-like peptidyl-prolyl isomerase
VDSAEIVQHYEANKDKYKEPEQVKASHILIPPPPPDTAGVESKKRKTEIIEQNQKETFKRAEAVFAKAKDGENWDSLVVKYSQDGTNNKKGGDLGYFNRGRMVPAFDSAAFASETGDIVGPIKTRFGYHIIKIDDHKMAQTRELDEELYSDIEVELRRTKEKEKADTYLDSLKAEAKYTYNEEALGQPDSLLEDGLWIMVVNYVDTVYEKRVKKDFPRYIRHYQIADTAWTAETKRDMLKDISVTYLLRSAARVLGYYDMPKAVEAKDELNRREAATRTRNLMRDLDYKPSEDEIKQYYEDNFDEKYKEKKPLHIQHIIFEDSAMAAAIRDSIANGADFKEMALKYYPGEPEIREVAYDLGFISEKELGPDFFNYIKTLNINDISVPVKTEWGYHVVKLVDKRDDKRLDQVRPGIKRALVEAADGKIKREYINQRRSEVTITIDEGKLKNYEFPESLRSVEITPEG